MGKARDDNGCHVPYVEMRLYHGGEPIIFPSDIYFFLCVLWVSYLEKIY
jgi:hypothetical protein